MRTVPADAAVKAGRYSKAQQFAVVAHNVLILAEEAQDVADAFVTLAVHAGIAASDVICCARLGEYPQGENHNDAIKTLEKADKGAAKHLRVLLGLKTFAGYSYTPVSAQDRVRAERAMDALVTLATELR